MAKRPTARELETEAAALPGPRKRARDAPAGEVARMLARRGFRPRAIPLDLPFPPDLDRQALLRVTEWLGHYSFRLFLRGAIQQRGAFAAPAVTRYLRAEQAREVAETLVDLGLAARLEDGRYRLRQPARSFGGTLEWYVSRELERRLGFDVAASLEFRAAGVGGDLDVVAAAEGKLLYLELKSSPPKNLAADEIAAFFNRIEALRPDLVLFVVDTALRLADKVVPLLVDELAGRRPATPSPPARLVRGVWAVTPRLYAVNAHRDLIANISRAVAAGLRALVPRPW